VKAELERRGVSAGDLEMPEAGPPWEVSSLALDAGPVLSGSAFGPLRDAVSRGDAIAALRLPGFAGILDHPTQPGRPFAAELADRVRVIACPAHRPFMLHSSDEAGALTNGEWKELRSALGAGSDDAVIVLWASAADVATAAREILIRVREALEGIPPETRQAFSDGTNGFERILPGPDRMYPDTDTPPLPVTDDTLAVIEETLPEAPWSRRARYEEMGLDSRTARVLAVAPWADLFDAVEPEPGPGARRLATVLEKRIPFHMRQRGIRRHRWEEDPDELPDPDRIRPLVRDVEEGTVRPEAMARALDRLLASPDASWEKIREEYRVRPEDDLRLRERVEEVAGSPERPAARPPEAVLEWAMGEVMPDFLGRVDPARVEAELARALELETGAETITASTGEAAS
jgi:glutamyl-tRNA(Gln) amidotransferase subunit E